MGHARKKIAPKILEPNFPFLSLRAQISAGAKFSKKLEPNFPDQISGTEWAISINRRKIEF